MNHMKEIAKMLGVEFYEKFKIEEADNENCRFYLDAAGLNWENDDVKDMDDETLVCLLTGKYHIIKLPWKPKDRETYFYVKPDGNITFGIFGYYCVTDIALLAFGNCFRTKEEAEAHCEEMLTKFQEVLKVLNR